MHERLCFTVYILRSTANDGPLKASYDHTATMNARRQLLSTSFIESKFFGWVNTVAITYRISHRQSATTLPLGGITLSPTKIASNFSKSILGVGWPRSQPSSSHLSCFWGQLPTFHLCLQTGTSCQRDSASWLSPDRGNRVKKMLLFYLFLFNAHSGVCRL